MALEVIRTAPTADQFTALSEHQSQTPGTFFGGAPVLYYHSANSTLRLDTSALISHPAFSQLSAPSSSSGAVLNGDSNAETTIPKIDVWVTSSKLTLFSTTASAGVSIPYPTISLHAQQANALYMQLILSDSRHTADEDLETLELLLTPSSTEPATTSTGANGNAPAQSSAQALFAAVSACADLHPDPTDSEEEDAEQEPEPGAGGWITAENMADFVDEDGNLRMPEESILGEGAGRRRGAEEFEDAEGEEEDESKWRRTG